MSVELSILIPAYIQTPREVAQLRKILDSLKKQTEKYPHTEILIVDDGSPEDIFWTSDYPKVFYWRQDNHGEGYARNVLIDRARGEYIQFIDADDEIYDNALDVIYSNMAEGYDYVSYEFDTDGDRTRSYHRYGELRVNNTFWGHTFKKAFYGDARCDETMKVGCDVEWLDRVLREDAKHKHDDRIWYNYRFDNNEQSLCHRFLRGEFKT